MESGHYGSPDDVKALPLLKRSAVAREDRIAIDAGVPQLARALG